MLCVTFTFTTRQMLWRFCLPVSLSVCVSQTSQETCMLCHAIAFWWWAYVSSRLWSKEQSYLTVIHRLARWELCLSLAGLYCIVYNCMSAYVVKNKSSLSHNRTRCAFFLRTTNQIVYLFDATCTYSNNSSSSVRWEKFVGSCSPERTDRKTYDDSRQSCQDDAGARCRRDNGQRPADRRSAVRQLVECRAPATDSDCVDEEVRHATESGARSQTLQQWQQRLIATMLFRLLLTTKLLICFCRLYLTKTGNKRRIIVTIRYIS